MTYLIEEEGEKNPCGELRRIDSSVWKAIIILLHFPLLFKAEMANDSVISHRASMYINFMDSYPCLTMHYVSSGLSY